ncbi:hypothetical protein SAMN05892883_1922 [Jatrophihabitans sp. GAS493]|uniref:hypothetical protein n=1 Tax=Jatrophihabitans sp. GAS493 TaxID=1907575 RepID=UPI000BBF8AF1|nr:hypothetical protein [Jatrophihabitans sp. GAS493]SOD72530.1 hypothetical protein SAMN05892883_1922 [Jatrophihabitans sp. GAS493]
MPYQSIKGTPPIVLPWYVPVDSPCPPRPAPYLTLFDELLFGHLTTQQQAAARKLLTTPLDQYVDALWTGQQDLMTAKVRSAIVANAPKDLGPVSDITVELPEKGTLQAEAAPLSPQAPQLQLIQEAGVPWPSGSSADAATVMTLQYVVPACNGYWTQQLRGGGFSLPATDWAVNFNFTLSLVLIVSDSTRYPMFLVAADAVTDMSVSAENWAAATVVAGLGIAAFFTGQPLSNLLHPPDQLGTFPAEQLSPDLVSLADAFTALPPWGFTEISLRVNPTPPAAAFFGAPPVALGSSAAVEIDLTHPCDGPPTITNASAIAGKSFSVATLTPSATNVSAGAQICVSGRGFPAGQATKLQVVWSDTCSGTLVESELQWGLAAAPPTPTSPGMAPFPTNLADVIVAPTSGPEGHNAYATPPDQPLTPNTWYAFRVRDFDCRAMVATQWSSWLFLQTQASEQVELVLDFQDLQLATVSLALSGEFTELVTVPADVAAGTYVLSAMSGSRRLAQTSLTIFAAGSRPPATLEMLSPGTNAPIQGLVTLFGATTVTVHGEHFDPGTVELWLDGAGATSLGPATVDGAGSFTASLAWPAPDPGWHKIVAAQPAPRQAEIPIWEGGIAQ